MVSGSALAATKPAVGAAKGFQMTEVGLIPDEWDVVRIGDIGTVGRGRVISHREILRSRNSLYPVYSSQTSNNGVMGYIDKFDFQGKYITWTTDGANAGTVFFRDGAFNCTNVCGTIKLDKHITEFVAIVLAKFAPKHVSRHLGNPKLMNDVMKKIQIPVPRSKNEQIAIAKSLNDTDELIDSLERLIAKKRQIKQGVMQDLLSGKRRLAGYNDPWLEKSFGEIFDFLPTATNPRSDLREDIGAYYVHYGDIHTRFHSHLNFRSQQPSRIDLSKCKNAALLKNGDWIMADASEDLDGVGKCIEIAGLGDGDQAVSGLHTFLLRERQSTFVHGFKGHLGNLKSLHEQYLRVMTGMKVFGVSKTALKGLILPIPSKDEQLQITAILDEMEAEICALENKVKKARQCKKGMMQELLTGRTRLT